MKTVLVFLLFLVAATFAYVHQNPYHRAAWVEGYSYSDDKTFLGFNPSKSAAHFEDDDTYTIYFDYTLPERLSEIKHIYNIPSLIGRQISYEVNVFTSFVRLEEFNINRAALESVHIKLQNVANDLNTIYTCHLNPLACPVSMNTSITPTVVFDMSVCNVCTDDGDDDVEHCALWNYSQTSFDLANIQSIPKCYNSNSTVPTSCMTADCIWIDLSRLQVITYQDVLSYSQCVHNIVAGMNMARTISLLEQYYFGASDPMGSVHMTMLATEIIQLEMHEHMVDDDDETYGVYAYAHRPCYNTTTRGQILNLCPDHAVEQGLWCPNPLDDDDDCISITPGGFGPSDFYYQDDDCENDAHARSLSATTKIVELLDQIARTLVRRMATISEHLMHSRLYNPVRYTFATGQDIFPTTALHIGELDGVA